MPQTNPPMPTSAPPIKDGGLPKSAISTKSTPSEETGQLDELLLLEGFSEKTSAFLGPIDVGWGLTPTNDSYVLHTKPGPTRLTTAQHLTLEHVALDEEFGPLRLTKASAAIDFVAPRFSGLIRKLAGTCHSESNFDEGAARR